MSPAQDTVAAKLEAAIKERGISVRALGRAIDPDDPEGGRRNVYRWLKGTPPEDHNAAALAKALRKPADYFKTPARVRVVAEGTRLFDRLSVLIDRGERLADRLEGLQATQAQGQAAQSGRRRAKEAPKAP